MDPLSICASIIAVLQATNTVVSVCYNFKAAIRNIPWSLTRVINEVQDVRNVLETLERLAEALDDTTTLSTKRRPAFELLCKPETGPLASCLRELAYLEEKMTSSSGVEKPGSKRRAFMQALSWQLKDQDAKVCLERIERCKSTLSLAITADEATLLLDIQNMTAALDSSMQIIGDKLTDIFMNLHAKDAGERHKDFMKWLSPLDERESHEAAVHNHQKGTGGWFVESKEFSDWHCADRSFLWLSGFPGAGKTTVFSYAVNYLIRNLNDLFEGARIAYVYCDFRRSESQDPINVIGSLVAQLCSQSNRYPERLEFAFDHSSNNTGQQRRPSFSELREALQSFARNNKIILLIDALDECSRRKDMLDFISNLGEGMQGINILITSRNGPDIQAGLKPFMRLRIESRLEEVNRDIRYYIDHRLQSDRKLQWLIPSIKTDIAHSLNVKSAGMFRWVQCQLDAISTLRTIKAVRIALKGLPQGLNETYENILMTIAENDIEIVRRILLWLAFAVLPLTLEELHTVIAIEQGLDHLDEESLLSSPQDILSLCGSLIDVSDQGHVRLAHLSVKDYLLSSEIYNSSSVSAFAMTPTDANYELAVNCLTYLNFMDVSKGPSPIFEDYIERLKRHPALKHAAVGWTYYVRASILTPKLNALILDFFSPQYRKSFMSWVQVLNADFNFKWDFYPRHATFLYYAASFGLVKTVEALIDNGANLNAPGSRFGGTALHAAVLRNHIPVMKLLLQAGADPNRADFNRVTPLHTAVVNGNVEIISMLLDFGVCKDAVDGIGETPYDWALKAGQADSLNSLLGGALETKEKVQEMSPQGESPQEVWKDSAPYFPDFYGRRSGLDSSIVVKVELGETILINEA